MQRVNIDLPPSFSYCTELEARITDINYGGHVGNHALLGWLHEARMRFLQHHGFQEMDAGGAALIMSDAAIQFKAELFFGDRIRIWVKAADFSRNGFDLYYKLEKAGTTPVVIAAAAKTGMVCFDYSKRKIISLPEVVSRTLQEKE